MRAAPADSERLRGQPRRAAARGCRSRSAPPAARRRRRRGGARPIARAGSRKLSGRPISRAASRGVIRRVRIFSPSTSIRNWRLDPPPGVRRQPASPSKRASAWTLTPPEPSGRVRRNRAPTWRAPDCCARRTSRRDAGESAATNAFVSGRSCHRCGSGSRQSMSRALARGGSGSRHQIQSAASAGGSPATTRLSAEDA